MSIAHHIQPGIPESQVHEFAAAVLQHIENELPVEEWKAFRFQYSVTNKRMLQGIEPDPKLPPDRLINMALSEQLNTLPEVLGGATQAEQIGVLDGLPIYYIKSAGYYAWANSRSSGLMLQVNLCFPSYPCE